MKPWISVVMRDPWVTRPRFHLTKSAEFESAPMLDPDAEEKHSRWTTACGVLMEELRWIERRTNKGYEQIEFLREQRTWTWLRFDNASGFGVPCKRCFPQLSAEPGTPLVSDVSDRSET